MTPPWMALVPPADWPALAWRLATLTPRTTILPLCGSVRSTSPCLPLSLPAITTTVSPGARSSQRCLVFALFVSISFLSLENLRREGHDLHEVALAQLAGDRPEDPGAPRVVLRVDDDRRVLVELDQRPVRPAILLGGPHDHGAHDLALLHLAAGLGGLDGGRDDVADPRVLAVVPAMHPDAEQLPCATVVGHL